MGQQRPKVLKASPARIEAARTSIWCLSAAMFFAAVEKLMPASILLRSRSTACSEDIPVIGIVVFKKKFEECDKYHRNRIYG
jgi:hypothetical protein